MVEGLFITLKEIKAQEYLPTVTTFTSRKMTLFIKIYRMKFYLISKQINDIR